MLFVFGRFYFGRYQLDLIYRTYLNFEATGERVPFARLKERTEDADELGYKSHTTVMSALKRLG